jgi:hypothetical protein
MTCTTIVTQFPFFWKTSVAHKRLSSGAAARLAGIPRVVFLARLADYGVDTFTLTEEQLQREARLA